MALLSQLWYNYFVDSPQTPVTVVPSNEQDIQQNKDLAALSYVWILAIVIYATRRDSAFIHFHAKQALVLFMLSIALWLIPVVGRYLEIIIVLLSVMGFAAAVQGQWLRLPRNPVTFWKSLVVLVSLVKSILLQTSPKPAVVVKTQSTSIPDEDSLSSDL